MPPKSFPRGRKDKIMRTNSIADMFASGMIWAPLHQRWTQDAVEQMAAFPHGEVDDLHDAAVWGLMRFRQGNPDPVNKATLRTRSTCRGRGRRTTDGS